MTNSDSILNKQWCLRKKLVEGLFGKIYIACDSNNTNRQVIVKEFDPTTACASVGSLDKATQLFAREIHLLSELAHPQIPKLYDSFVSDSFSYLVEEYISGKSYSNLIESRQSQGYSFTEMEVSQFLLDLLPVLEYIHKKGIIHRDIAPDNLIFSDEMEKPALIDFGVARRSDEERARKLQTPSESLLSSSTRVLKLGYSAPELSQGGGNANSDLYSLAMICVVMLTGKHPTELYKRDSLECQWQHHTEVTPRLASILNKMLAQEPRSRYQSATEALRELNRTEVSTLSSSHHGIDDAHVTFVRLPSRLLEKVLMLALATFIVTATIATGAIYQIWPMCYLGSRCISQETVDIYKKALETETTAKELEENAKNLKDLDEAYDKLTNSVNSLQSIDSSNDRFSKKKVTPKLETFIFRLEALQIKIAEEEKAQREFELAKELGEESDSWLDEGKTLANAQKARENLEAGLERLSSIPQDSLRFDQSQQLSENYREKRNSLVQHIENAKDVLDESERIAKDATKLTDDGWFSVDMLNAAKARWEDALEILEQVADDSIIFGEAQARIFDYDGEVTDINAQIQALLTPPPIPEPEPVYDANPGSQAQPDPPAWEPPPEQQPLPPKEPPVPSCDVALFGECQ